MWARYLPILALIAPFVFGDVQFTSPDAGATLTASGSTVEISVAWTESGHGPPLPDLAEYSIYLNAGGNTVGSYQQIGKPLARGKSFGAGSTMSAKFSITAGESIDNAYFLQIVSIPIEGGGTIMNYSPRFSLSGMTGSFPPEIKTAAQGVTGTAGPDTQDTIITAKELRKRQAADPYDVPYSAQSGAIKYAPMQGNPPTKITAKTASPRYPTSSVSLYKEAAPTPKQVTTNTMSRTYSVSSRENPATPAAQPHDDMQKYLKRWKD